MATAIIKFFDTENGGVDMLIRFDPPIRDKKEIESNAQVVGLMVFREIANAQKHPPFHVINN